ncbi:MAG: site-2 protease family protein [Actinomycetota bacterium]
MPVFVHVSWFFIAGLVLLGFWGRLVVVHSTLDRVSIAALAVLGTVLFFGSVLLHELAHALVARRRGIEVERITLYLFGGATEADPARRSAADEFTVAIVGPLTSVALAITFAVGALGVGVAGAGDAPRDLLVWLSGINLLLAVFNMAPGLPLDGGRVFRSTVWALTGDFARATRWATTGGVLVGFATMSVGLLAIWRGGLGGLWLVAIGWMISQSARQNEQQERLRAEFLGLVAADIMTSPVITIPADLSIAEAIRHYFSQRSETAFPVVDDSTIRGLLSVAAVRTVPPGELVSTTAGEVARRNEPPVIVGRATPMLDVIAAMAGAGRRSLRALVVEDGIVVGIISPSDVLRRDAIADLLEATSPTQ